MIDLKINHRGKLIEKPDWLKILVENAKKQIQDQIDDEIFQALESAKYAK